MSEIYRSDHGKDFRFPKTVVETEVRAKQPLDVFKIVEPVPIKNRTPEEIDDLKRKIGLIARVFSRKYNMEVYPSSNGGWSCSLGDKSGEVLEKYMKGELPNLDDVSEAVFQPTRINYDIKDIEGGMTESQVLGVMRHEVGHAKNTDYKLFIEGQKLALDEGYLPSSYAQGWNACEDPWVNNKEIGESETVREHMTELYRKWLPEVVSKINTQPVSHQLGLNIIHYWLTGQSIPTLNNAEVQKLFDSIQPYVDQYFEADTAVESNQIFREHIWEAFKSLEKKAEQDEKTKEMMRKMSGKELGKEPEAGQGQSQGQEGQGQAGGKEQGQSQDGGSGGKPQSMTERLKKIFGFGKKKEIESPPPVPQSDQPTQAGPSESSSDDESNQPLRDEVSKEMEKQKQAAKQRNEDLKKQGAPSGELPDDIDLSQVPQDLKDKIQAEIDKMTDEQKKELEKVARELLDKKQAEAANKKMPKGIRLEKDPKTGQFIPKIKNDGKNSGEAVKNAVDEFNKQQDKTAEEATKREAEAEAVRKAVEAEARKKELEKVQMAKDGFDIGDVELFRKFKSLEQSMESQIVSFMRVMDRYLPRKEEVSYGGEPSYFGHKISKSDIPKRVPVGDFRIKLPREIIESEEPRLYVTLLIDNSGSMAGQKMDESVKTAVFLARVLKRFEIPFGIKYFGDHVDEAMKLGDNYDDPKKKIKPNILKKGNASGAGTDMASPLLEAVEEMTAAKRKYVGCHGSIFVISDSGANSGPKTGTELAEYIKEKQKTFSILNFLLSNSSRDLAEAKSLFGEGGVIQSTDFSNLPAEAFKVLRIVLERVLKTFKSN